MGVELGVFSLIKRIKRIKMGKNKQKINKNVYSIKINLLFI
jgi:hypothetical protein